jgi:hypothetical protein
MFFHILFVNRPVIRHYRVSVMKTLLNKPQINKQKAVKLVVTSLLRATQKMQSSKFYLKILYSFIARALKCHTD